MDDMKIYNQTLKWFTYTVIVNGVCIIPYFLAHDFLKLNGIGVWVWGPRIESPRNGETVWALVEQLGRMGVKARLPPAPCKKKTSD